MDARRVLNEHFGYLSDDVRLDAYRRALQSVVTPETVAVDLGCGTGVLGWLALQAGAKRVYAIDRTAMIEVARELARENGCADRIVHLRGSSREAVLPEQADLVLADQLGPLGFDADMAGDFADAAARFLSPAGRLIPEAVETWIAPVEAPETWRAVDRWSGGPSGMQTRALRSRAANTTIYSIGGETLLGDPHTFFRFAQGDGAPPTTARAAMTWTITRDGTLHGLLGWFVATLAPGITLTNGPLDAPRMRRAARLFPIDPAVAVQAGDVVRAEVIAGLAQQFFVWRVAVSRGDETLLSVEQTTLRGELRSSEDLGIDGSRTR